MKKQTKTYCFLTILKELRWDAKKSNAIFLFLKIIKLNRSVGIIYNCNYELVFSSTNLCFLLDLVVKWQIGWSTWN